MDLIKRVDTNISLDALSLMKDIAEASLGDITNSFYSNGMMIETHAVRALKKIQGRMEALKMLVENTK